MRTAELDGVPEEIWRRLYEGDGPWRTPVVASAKPDGGANARTVVIRSVDAAMREIVFFTDRRSAKLGEMQAEPRVCVVVYDSESRLQARLYGCAHREQDAATLDDWWQSLGAVQKRLYATDVIADQVGGDNEKGRENFAAFRIVVDRLHCLWIGEAINEAAEFEWRDARWEARVVRP